MLPNEFKPLKIDEKNLIRIGPKMDGGYVLDKRVVKDIETIITCGLNDDWEFERHFYKLKPDINIFAYDHTVNSNFWIQRFLKDILHYQISTLYKAHQKEVLTLLQNTEYCWVEIPYTPDESR